MQTRGSVLLVDGRYELERELTRGPSVAVWRARDALLGRTVTLEVVHPSLADDPAFTERLAEQARAMARFSAPGLARLLDTGVEDGVPFLVRDELDGITLRERLRADGPLEPGRALAIVGAVLETVDAVHEAGMVHLAIGPDTIFVGDGAPRLTELGIGAALARGTSADGRPTILEPDTVAPEVSRGIADRRSDVYSVGATLFEMLAGEPPGDRTSVRSIRPEIPRRVDRAIAHALAEDPGERYADARAFARALRPTEHEDVEAPASRGVVRTWLAIPIVVVVAAAAVIAAGLWLGRLEVGGPLGIRAAEPSPAEPSDGSGTPTVESIRPVSATAFDPLGDGAVTDENDSIAPNAIDGDLTTAWHTEDYFDSLLHKDGVGIVFDLGQTRRLTGFRLWTPHPGFVFHLAVGDDPDALVDRIGAPFTAEPEMRGPLSGTGRYVLVWITTVVDTGDGHRAEISEFRALADPDA